jgi:hypothetical protein
VSAAQVRPKNEEGEKINAIVKFIEILHRRNLLLP